MPKTALLVGTRKGLVLLESDGDRRKWKARGPFCEGWPIYHAVHDPATGAIYAAAAKPKSEGRPSVISFHECPPSSLRCMPQWFC